MSASNLLPPRYDEDGHRLTNCCGAFSTLFEDGTLYCKKCYAEVSPGEGDGSDDREEVKLPPNLGAPNEKSRTSFLFLATVETRSFSFEGVGRTEAEAVEACRLAWEAHCAQYEHGPGMLDWETDLSEDCFARKMVAGTSYRDREEIK